MILLFEMNLRHWQRTISCYPIIVVCTLVNHRFWTTSARKISQLWYKRARFVSLQGELDSAESEVRYILAQGVYSKDAEYVLGRILELKGSFKEARHYFHKVLKKDYRHTAAREGLQRLNKKV